MANLIFCTESPENHAQVERFATEMGLPLQTVSTSDALREKLLDANNKKLFFIDSIMFQKLDTNTLTLLNSQSNVEAALLTEDEPATSIPLLKMSSSIRHVVSFCSKSKDEKLRYLFKLAGHRLAGASLINVLIPGNISLTKVVLTDSDQRWKCYEDVGNIAEELGCFSGFTEIVRTVASELITNAFYDAPRDPATGRALFPDRKTRVQLEPGKEVLFYYGREQDYFWMMVKDPFGTLNRDSLIAALFRAFTERTAKIESEGGAGLGLITVLRWASEFLFDLSEPNSTTVACKLRISKRHKVFSEERAMLHILDRK